MMRSMPFLLVLGMAATAPAAVAESESSQDDAPREAIGDVAPGAGSEAETDVETETPPAESPSPMPAEETPATAETEPRAEPTPLPGRVARARFTSAVVNREPVDEIDGLQNNVREIYYFTELRDMGGQTVTHRWEYDGRVMAEVSFDVGGDRWRVWSKKSLVPAWTGRWTVSVVNERDEVIGEDGFRYARHVGGETSAQDGAAAPATEGAPEPNDAGLDPEPMSPPGDEGMSGGDAVSRPPGDQGN